MGVDNSNNKNYNNNRTSENEVDNKTPTPRKRLRGAELDIVGGTNNNNNNSAFCQYKFRFSKLLKGGNFMNILERMEQIGMKQVDMIFELRKRGIAIQPPELSNTLRGVSTYPKSKRVLEECELILNEREHHSE